MNAWQFMSEHPYLTFFLSFMTVSLLFKCWNRLMRHLNIKARGWPPVHCDADGDFKEDEE